MRGLKSRGTQTGSLLMQEMVHVQNIKCGTDQGGKECKYCIWGGKEPR